MIITPLKTETGVYGYSIKYSGHVAFGFTRKEALNKMFAFLIRSKPRV